MPTCEELNDFINRNYHDFNKNRQISAALESFGKLFSIIVPLQQFPKVFFALFFCVHQSL